MQYIRNFLSKERPATMDQLLKLDEVIIDNDLNPREGALDQDVVLDYSAHVDDLPPMTAFDIQGFYYLVGGFHRYAAHRLAMRTEGRFVVHVGDRNEAKEFADLDNLKHGLRLSRAERRRVIERQLKRHPEWSDVRLATACASTDKTVRVVREELEANLEIPRLDALVGSDGITRPRTISQPARQAEPEEQPTFEGVVSIEDGYVNVVREGQGQSIPLSEFEAEPGSTPITDTVMALPDEEKDIAINDPAIYEAMGREQVAAGLAENDTDPQPGEAEMMTPMTHQVDQAHETEAAREDQPQPQLESPPPAEPRPAAPAVPPPPPRLEPVERPAPPSPPPPPPPVVREAAWVLSLSKRPDLPVLVTILHGADPQMDMPAEVAEEFAAAILAKKRAEAEAEAEWLSE